MKVQATESGYLYNKLCIDVGCNDGKLTMEIAKLCRPRLIIGIDTDNKLIESAQKLSKRIIFQHEHGDISTMKAGQLLSKIISKDGNIPPSSSSSSALALVPRAIAFTQSCSKAKTKSVAIENQFSYPYNVKFLCKTVFELSSSSLYEVVLCLSVVKWVHLQEGDAGLLHFLRRLHGLLRWDGLLILEFQPWKSYVNNRSTSERTKSVFATIRIRPENFQDILKNDVGFDLEGNLGTDLQTAAGFSRPIYLLRKKRQGSSSNAEEIVQRISVDQKPKDRDGGLEIAVEGKVVEERIEVEAKEPERKSKKQKRKRSRQSAGERDSTQGPSLDSHDQDAEEKVNDDADYTFNIAEEEGAALSKQGLDHGSSRKRRSDDQSQSVEEHSSAGVKRKR